MHAESGANLGMGSRLNHNIRMRTTGFAGIYSVVNVLLSAPCLHFLDVGGRFVKVCTKRQCDEGYFIPL